MTACIWKCVPAFALLFAVAAETGEVRAADAPKRIVSLNLCTDQLLIDLVPRDHIAAVSFLATDRTLSASADRLRGLKQLKGTAEEVLALKPDLILAGTYTTRATVDLLIRLGQRVLIVPMANSFDGMRASLRLMAEAVGAKEKGEAIIAEFDDRLRGARSTVPSRPTALAYQVNSLISGQDSLLDAALDAAGYRNLARDMKLGPGDRLPLEKLVLAPPDLLVLANAPGDFQTVLADNLRHPAFTQLVANRPSVHLPMPYWMCATPKIADAVELLASLKRSSLAHAARPTP